MDDVIWPLCALGLLPGAARRGRAGRRAKPRPKDMKAGRERLSKASHQVPKEQADRNGEVTLNVMQLFYTHDILYAIIIYILSHRVDFKLD